MHSYASLFSERLYVKARARASVCFCNGTADTAPQITAHGKDRGGDSSGGGGGRRTGCRTSDTTASGYNGADANGRLRLST